MRTAGFTLLELLVVVAVIALLMTAVPMAIGSGSGVQLDAQARRIAAVLREAHARALGEAGEIRLGGEDLAQLVADDTGSSHDRGLELHASGPRREIAFFPDGTSSGGTVRLERGRDVVEVSVDWLTGQVRIAAGQ
jgi:general secretion pathway protein H